MNFAELSPTRLPAVSTPTKLPAVKVSNTSNPPVLDVIQSGTRATLRAFVDRQSQSSSSPLLPDSSSTSAPPRPSPLPLKLSKESLSNSPTKPDAAESKSPRVRIRYHVFPGETPTVYFPYPTESGAKPRADPPSTITRPKKTARIKFLLYWERNCIKAAFKAAGLTRSSALDPARYPNSIQGGGGDWNVAWSKHFPIEQYRTLRPYQRVNSFPGTQCIGKKDALASLMERFDRRFAHSDAYKYVPQSFILRGLYGEMEKFLRAARLRAGHTDRRHSTGSRAPKFVSRSAQRKKVARRKSTTSSGRGSKKRTKRKDDDDTDTDSDDEESSSGDDEGVYNELEQDKQSIAALRRRAEVDQRRMSVKSNRYRAYSEEQGSTDDSQNGSDLWICKPPSGACGRGIRLVQYQDVPKLPLTYKAAESKKNGSSVPFVPRQRVWNVQEYIADPLCIGGRKFDLRVYVLVTSFDPLRVYVFREGLCRICTNEYDLDYDHLGDTFRHLTNFSINKNADKFVANQNADQDDHGHKWSLSALFDHLDAHGYDIQRLWRDMKEVAVKTLIACESEIFTKLKTLNGADKCCYEVFGFDMLLNESLFVYLIEVNIYPSMATGSPLDKRIKQTMISDALQIKGVPIPSKDPSVNFPGTTGGGLSNKRSNGSRTKQAKQKRETLKKRLRTGKLGKLSSEDLTVIKTSAAEFARAGTTNYDLAFPTSESIRRLADFFVCPRYNNTLLHMLVLQEDQDEEDVKPPPQRQQTKYDDYPTSKPPPRRFRKSKKR